MMKHNSYRKMGLLLALIITIIPLILEDSQLQRADSSSMRVTFREKLVLLDGEAFVDVARWSPTGDLIATAESFDGLPQIKIWDSVNGELIQVIQPDRHYNAVNSLEWSPSGQYLASSYEISGGLVHIWDIFAVNDPLFLEMRHETEFVPLSKILSLAWHPDGSRLMSTGGNDAGESEYGTRTIDFWDTSTGEFLNTLPDSDNGAIKAIWSPDGQYIAASTWFDDIRIWDASDMSLISVTEGYQDDSKFPISTIDWSPDGKYIATVSCSHIPGDCVIWTLDVSAGTLSEPFPEAHILYVNDLDWHPDGRLIASAGAVDKNIRIWDAETHEELASIEVFEDEVTSVSWSPDGSMLVASSWDGSARVWEIEIDDD